VDPLVDGLKVLDAHHLPDPLGFDVPTVIGHVSLPEVAGELLADLDRMLDEDAEVCLLVDLGTGGERLVWARPLDHDVSLAGPRTSVYVPPVPTGLFGVVDVMRRLRQGCPWDRTQTHASLVRYLLEEANELADAIATLPPDGTEIDWGAYADV